MVRLNKDHYMLCHGEKILVKTVRGTKKVVVIGAGFTGLSAAWELAKAGHFVTVLEKEENVGGLAGTFDVHGTQLEKFYHHWFTSDKFVFDLVHELDLSHMIEWKTSKTGMYFANNFYRLSSPVDLLKFKPLSLPNRIRLGVLTIGVRWLKSWKRLEKISARDWLIKIGGKQVFEIVWQPLLIGKFGKYAEKVSAVWIWNKLKLRGGSRSGKGSESLAYFKGGFANLAERLSEIISETEGCAIEISTEVNSLVSNEGRISGVKAGSKTFDADIVIITTPLPIAADIIAASKNTLPSVSGYLGKLRRIRYLANVCLVLQLDRSLSETYWLNVNDPSFPYVAIIEHTNFESKELYGGNHIVYLSKYLSEDDPLYQMNDDDVFEFSIAHIMKMFPKFNRSWVNGYSVWRARYSQPIVECGYSDMIPEESTPIAGLFVTSMAQIYPEDRGTNYAIRQGRRIGSRIAAGEK